MRIFPCYTKCRIPCLLSVLSLFFSLLCVINLFSLLAMQDLYQKQYDYSLSLRQAIQAKNLFNAVSQVQNQLSDISATLGLDNLDQGFGRAREATAEFYSGVTNLQQLMGRQPVDSDLLLDWTALVAQFDQFYEQGLAMSKAYMHSGTLQGNQKMKVFDAQAEALRQVLLGLIDRLEQQTTHWQLEMSRDQNAFVVPTGLSHALWLRLMGTKTRTHYIQFLTNFIQNSFQQDQRMGLSLKAQELRGLVIHVQQWLTDLSATRGRDGLDEGKVEALKGAEHFRSALPDFLAQVEQTDNREWMGRVEGLGARFERFYVAGQAMAVAYREGGVRQGNVRMVEFDAMADELEQILLIFITPSIQEIFAGNYQMDLVFHSMLSSRKVLMFLLGFSLIVTVICCAWLVSCFMKQAES